MTYSNKILIVDDSAPYIRLICESLIDSGDKSIISDNLLFASDAETAIQLFAEAKPVLTLMDVRMPFKSGVDIANDLRHIDKSANICFLTNYPKGPAAMESVAKQVSMGALDKNMGTDAIASLIGFLVKIFKVAA